MAYPSGQYYLDGADLWLVYGMFIMDRAGTDALLRFPKRKDSISHDWSDENGLDVDLSRVFLESRVATFRIGFLAEDDNDFWNKYYMFLNKLQQPGLRRLEISELGSSYYVYYKDCTDFSRKTRLLEGPQAGKIAAIFSIILEEPQPQNENTNVYLVTEEGRFLIT